MIIVHIKTVHPAAKPSTLSLQEAGRGDLGGVVEHERLVVGSPHILDVLGGSNKSAVPLGGGSHSLRHGNK